MDEPAFEKHDKTARKLIAGVIPFAVVGVIALPAITYKAFYAGSDQLPEQNKQHAPAPAPTQPAAPKETGAAKPDGEILSRYSDSIQPLLERTRSEMEGVKIELRQFLKTVNSSSSQLQTKRIIDGFRDQLTEREKRLSALSDSIKSIVPPLELEPHHKRLSAGVAKYAIAVQSYIRGLSAYSFNQIRASQTDLEAADNEIKSAAD